MSLIQGNTKVSAGGYTIDQSLRLNRSASAYLSKTFASDGGDNYTISFWTKRCMSHSVVDFILGVPGNGGYGWEVHKFVINDDGVLARYSTAVYRDPSAWYHVCIQNDASTGNTIYINNEVVTMSGTSNVGTVNGATTHYIGRFGSSAANFYDGYMADWVFLSDQVAAPTDFGEYNADGVWVPVDPSGLDFSGTNSHWLNFADSANLGADASGNGFDFTTTNISSDDQVTDTPTDNYATLNPLNMSSSGGVTLKDGNLNADATGTATDVMATIFVNSGKYYVEYQINTADSSTSNPVTGIQGVGFPTSPKANIDRNGGYDYDGTTGTLSPAFTYTTSDVVMMAFDVDAKKIWFGKNGTWYNSGDPGAGTGETLSWAADGDVAPYVRSRNSSDVTVNFGQLGFDYTPPTGFSKLSTANLPTPAIVDGSAYFQTTLFTGTGAELEVNQIENSTFQPDVVWIKQRNKVDNHVLTDAVRGAPLALYPNGTSSELIGTGGITGLDPDGFTLSGDGNVWNNVNQSGITAAAWQWLAGNGTASNSDGSITSTVSANTTAGFSVVTYTGTGSLATVGHGLGVTPAMFVVKRRDSGGNWPVFQDLYGSGAPANNGYLRLNSSAAWSGTNGNNHWNDTSPTSSVFTVKDDSDVNASGGTYVAYCFANVDGYSKIGSYTGNGSADGPFVWCGFRPALIVGKSATAAENWWMYDTARNTYNVADDYLSPNLTNAESTAAWFDINSNGFKVRDNGNAPNGSGATIIFMAFAEHPFGGDGVAPVPAR